MITTQQQAAGADAKFGADLYRALSRRGNVVFSPASIAAALKMALAGARGATAAEITAALRLDAPEDGPASLRQLAGLKAGDDLTFRAPNTMWLDEALIVREDYVTSLAGTVDIARANFQHAPEAARQAINAAVSTQTEGKITDLLPDGVIVPDTRLVLVNAVYLNALWTHKFPADKTDQKPFFAERPEPSVLPTMHLQAKLAYHRGDGHQSVLLPYRGGTLAMAVVLPDGQLDEFAGGFDVAEVLNGLLAPDAECLVDLSLPRFRVEASFRLEDTLQSLGVRTAFSDNADFSGISDEHLQIDAVIHKAYIDVTEEGTEAAAATGMTFRRLALVRTPDPDVRLVIDRPFVFAVVDTRTGLPLFLGQFTGPAR
jgi:serpin B